MGRPNRAPPAASLLHTAPCLRAGRLDLSLTASPSCPLQPGGGRAVPPRGAGGPQSGLLTRPRRGASAQPGLTPNPGLTPKPALLWPRGPGELRPGRRRAVLTAQAPWGEVQLGPWPSTHPKGKGHPCFGGSRGRKGLSVPRAPAGQAGPPDPSTQEWGFCSPLSLGVGDRKGPGRAQDAHLPRSRSTCHLRFQSI